MRQTEASAGVGTADVRQFWEDHPLSADAIASEPGTPEFYDEHNRLRTLAEPLALQEAIYEWRAHPGERLLDVGCGTGFVVWLYARGGARVTGVDLTHRGVQLTRRRLELNRLDAALAQADAERLPFRDAAFDMVTSYGVLHHTPDTAGALREVARVLKPGGRLILMFYHKGSYDYRLLFPLKRLANPAWRRLPVQAQVNAVDGAGNPLGKVFSRSEVRAMLPGFERFEFATAGSFFRTPALVPAPVVAWLKRRWGWLLYIKAYKSR